MPELMGRPGRKRAAVSGAVAGLRRHEQASREVGMFYLDRDADLDTPQEERSAG
jgi:hypothetical protein